MRHIYTNQQISSPHYPPSYKRNGGVGCDYMYLRCHMTSAHLQKRSNLFTNGVLSLHERVFNLVWFTLFVTSVRLSTVLRTTIYL